MSRPRALDLFCCAGGMSVGLQRAGFDVVGVDISPQPHHRGGEFLQADAMEILKDRAFLRTFDFVHASPPCQAYTSLRHVAKASAKAPPSYPDLIGPVRFHLERAGVAWSIENVPGAPLRGFVTLLCGTMFGLMTPDGRAEIRRHRLFETSFSIPLRPACQHGHVPITVSGDRCNSANTPQRVLTVAGEHPHDPAARHRARAVLSVAGHTAESASGPAPERKAKVLCVAGGKRMSGGMMTPPGELKRQKVLTVAGSTPQRHEIHNTTRETFSIEDARAAMQIDWMPTRSLSQAIPPIYATWIGLQALSYLETLERTAC